MPKYNIPRILKARGIKRNSRKLTDYEEAKRWLYYRAIEREDFDKYMKQIRDYVGV